MSFTFDVQRGWIVVRTELVVPSGSGVLRLAHDTGATRTLINVGMLVAVGCDPALAGERVQVTTGRGVEFAPGVARNRIAALGQSRTGFPVLAHTLPPSASVDGLQGLDYFRGRELRIDFRHQRIILS